MLKLRGFRVSLHDFVTGYSNISYLRCIPLDVIKLDRSLINDDLIGNRLAHYLMQHHCYAEEPDYTVLAGGVEGTDTLSALRKYGCNQGQFFCYRPLPEAELNEWLFLKLHGQSAVL